MEFRIDREALAEFIRCQVELVEAASIPSLLADVVELRMRHESVSRERGARALARRGAGDACRARDLRGARALHRHRPVTHHTRRGARRLNEGGDHADNRPPRPPDR